MEFWQCAKADSSWHAGIRCVGTCCWPLAVLWPWPWPDDLHIRTWPVLPGDTPTVQTWTSYVKSFKSYRPTDRQTDRHTYKIDRNYKPRRFAVVNYLAIMNNSLHSVDTRQTSFGKSSRSVPDSILQLLIRWNDNTGVQLRVGQDMFATHTDKSRVWHRLRVRAYVYSL